MAKTIIVLHLTGQYPMAGVAFHTLNYILGLARLGYNVYAVEDSGAPPYNPKTMGIDKGCAYSVEFVKKAMEAFGLGNRWSYVFFPRRKALSDDSADSKTYYGISQQELSNLYGEADAIVNLYGCTHLRKEHMKCPVRIYVETDPVGTEIEIANGSKAALKNLEAHTHHFTYGENLGEADCPIPLPVGFDWQKTRPPVVTDLWKYSFDATAEKFNTITTWRNDQQGVVFQGKKYYWSKHLALPPFQDLPGLTNQKFELAVGAVKGEGTSFLEERGWSVVDAFEKSSDLDVYRNYIYESKGEFSVAKDLVVSTNSGWFDARSVCYLAAGKPVVLQETGFSKFVPTGQGLFSFRTLQEAVDSIKEISSNYEYHCKQARAIAEKHFDSDKVLGDMMKQAGL